MVKQVRPNQKLLKKKEEAAALKAARDALLKGKKK